MSDALSAAVSIGFHGLAFAMVLYLISVGLSVTMGLMGQHAGWLVSGELARDHGEFAHSADHGTTRSISARNAARRVVLA
jgi:hypothetical protein